MGTLTDRFRATISKHKDTRMKDEAKFYYQKGWSWQKIGVDHKLYFKLDHFTGCRFGLFMYSTKETGGQAGFKEFVYKER